MCHRSYLLWSPVILADATKTSGVNNIYLVHATSTASEKAESAKKKRRVLLSCWSARRWWARVPSCCCRCPWPPRRLQHYRPAPSHTGSDRKQKKEERDRNIYIYIIYIYIYICSPNNNKAPKKSRSQEQERMGKKYVSTQTQEASHANQAQSFAVRVAWAGSP